MTAHASDGAPTQAEMDREEAERLERLEEAAARQGWSEKHGTAANGTAPEKSRYDGRVLDVARMLAEPDEPIPWRCDNLAADGYLTVLAGRGGEGKSWLALALASGVARGQPAAGIDCRQGRALIFDAENGSKLIARRFRAAEVTAELDVQPVDAGGLKLSKDLDWFRRTIVGYQANLVVFDSLRVLSTGTKESDADEMEPLITALKQLSRDTGAAVVLIHHRGKGEGSEYRGSSVILDQTDMLYTLGRVQGDPEGRTRRKITTVKCRIEEEPTPRWIAIEADRTRGLVFVHKAEPYETEDTGRPRDTIRDDVLDALGDTPKSCRSIAKALDKPEPTVRRVLHDLLDDQRAEQHPAGWVRQQGASKPDAADAPPHHATETVRHPRASKGGDARDAPPETSTTTGYQGASQGASPPPPADAPPGADSDPQTGLRHRVTHIGTDAPDAPPNATLLAACDNDEDELVERLRVALDAEAIAA